MDIVERLRISAGCAEMDDPIKWGAGSSDVMRAAAVEIDRLRGDCQGFKSAYDQACKDRWNLTEKVIPNLRDEIARLRDELTAACKTNSEWLAANGPGEWINDLRDENAKLSALLLWALYHHQGGSSEVGQPIRRALGIGQYDPLTPSQIEMAKSAAMPAEPAPEEPRVMARFDDGRPMMTYHRAAMREGE